MVRGRAFGALRRCLFASSSVSPAAKAAAYEGVVLAILLYGSESWCLTEVLLQQLRALHGRCLRSMCRVTRAHTWRLRITSDELMCRLGLDAADFYVARRQLGWLGHELLAPSPPAIPLSDSHLCTSCEHNWRYGW